jgi:cytochrome c-type biogenesis protein CcmH/NrfG
MGSSPEQNKQTSPARADASPPEKGRVWLLSGAIVALILVCFSPAFSAGFVSWDDADNLLKNPHWRGFSLENIRWMFTAFHIGHYQPLTWVSYAIDFELGKMDPAGYHAVNVLIHAANAVLFFVLTRRLMRIAASAHPPAAETGTRDLTIAAAIAAGLWALHPLRVESVAWVTERRDVLSTLFMLGAALAYVSAASVGGPKLRSCRAYWLSVLLLALSCLSKAWGMSFFVIMLALDVYPLRRLSSNPVRWFSKDALRVAIEKLPMVAIGVATAVVAAKAQSAGRAAKPLEEWPLAARLAQSCYGLWFYVQKSLAPSNLSPLYQLPDHFNPFESRFVIAYVFVAIVAVAVLIAWRRRPAAPIIPVAAAIYVILLSPVLGLLQSGEQLVADRYSYIATMPLAILVGAGWLWLMKRAEDSPEGPRAAILLKSVAAVAALSLGALTYSQSTVWHDSLTLWSHAVAAAPCSFSCDYLGDELLHRSHEGKDPKDRSALAEDAARSYQEAVRLSPHDGRAWFSLATLLNEYGRKTEAEQAFLNAAPYLPVAYQAYQNLGYLYAEQGRNDEAIHQFELAVADLEDPTKSRRPLSGGPYMALGLARKKQGRIQEAVALFKKAEPYQDTHEVALRELLALEHP